MALIKCSECGSTISDRTNICPNCGMPIRQQKSSNRQNYFIEEIGGQPTKSPNKSLYIVITVLLVVILLLGGIVAWNSGLFSSETEAVNQKLENLDPVIKKLVDNMVLVEGGTFLMGATPEQGHADYDEYPTHQVTLSSYKIGRFEVTQEEWEKVMGGNPSAFSGSKCPVEMVNWEDCQDFIAKLNEMTDLNFRLPTEAEWEFAARGGKNTTSCQFAGGNDLYAQGWYVGNSGNRTKEVGQKAGNELDLYDMTGNLWEWCSDWYGTYPGSAQENPTGPTSGSSRAIRGGGWNGGPRNCRISNRDGRVSTYKSNRLGLRLVVDVEEEKKTEE